MLAVEDEVLVDLVGHGDQVVLAAERRDRLELGAVEHAAGRVVGRVEQHEPRALRHGRRELAGVEAPLGRPQRHAPQPRAASATPAA